MRQIRKAHLLVLALLLITDQSIKWISRHLLSPEGVFLIPGYLGLEPYQNPGIAFGIPVPHIILTLGTVILTAIFAIWGIKKQRFAALLVATGGLSNAVDRILFGVTFDYIRIGPLSLVNLADTMIAIGLVLLFVRHREPEKS